MHIAGGGGGGGVNVALNLLKQMKFEPRYEKSRFWHMPKQRRRSVSG